MHSRKTVYDVRRKKRFKISVLSCSSMYSTRTYCFVETIVMNIILDSQLPSIYLKITLRQYLTLVRLKYAYINLSFPISRPCRLFFNAQGAKPVWYAKATRLVYETGEGPSFLFERNFPCRHLSAYNRLTYTTDQL